MTVKFIIKALNQEIFSEYLSKSDNELKTLGAQWLTVDVNPGYPCRVSLTDAKLGEWVLALSFCHHDVNSPYRATGPIFVRAQAITANLNVNEVPTMLRHRLLSVRAYNTKKMMIDAETLEGSSLEGAIESMFHNSQIEYIHIHNAGPGCFNCSVYRA
ncbi:DUF1203 domain-containing protein [Marinicella rhabdoformis]|uniref:DUF1203 domain-containing protein n=1 Tax=Marinicella rhabdoformis TaxID=2580566 RepID=UPI0012AEB2FD|nr:DUF1203 domain-containing protein [Marinicella rhabdoformis]